MSEVRLLNIGEVHQEVFTRWDITGHQISNVSTDIGYEAYEGQAEASASA